MSQPIDAQIRLRASLYTGGIALILTLLILFLKWRIEIPVKPEESTSIEEIESVLTRLLEGSASQPLAASSLC